VSQGLKKQIFTVFEPMYFYILNDDVVGFSNTSAREIVAYFFTTYGSIAAVDLDQNFAPCARHGTRSSQLKLFSIRFKTLWIF
jgi:hypothetical protein